MIVAWHEVPGTASPQKSRPVGYDMIRAGALTDSKIGGRKFPMRYRQLVFPKEHAYISMKKEHQKAPLSSRLRKLICHQHLEQIVTQAPRERCHREIRSGTEKRTSPNLLP